jgi:hypothetical protein
MGAGPMMSGNFVAQSFSFSPFSGIFTGNLVLDNNALNNVLPSPEFIYVSAQHFLVAGSEEKC